MITQERVRELFDYREDGALVWIKRTSNVVSVGDVAGCVGADGYERTKVDGMGYLNHRLVWLWHRGRFPVGGLDHIDRIKTHNFIENLREATQTGNMRNTGNRRHNTSGVKGVGWNKESEKWRARVTSTWETVLVGKCADFLEAVCHRLAAEQCLGWAKFDGSSPAFQYSKKYIPHIK